MSTTSEIRLTMRSVRLTGDQSSRLMRIAREKDCEIYDYQDRQLAEWGLLFIGDIPPHIRKRIERQINVAWRKIQRMARQTYIGTADIKTIESAANEMDHASYHLDKKYVRLTASGRNLVAKGRIVIKPGSLPAIEESL